MHLGYHFGREQEGHNEVKGEGQVLQLTVIFKSLRRVHADGQDAEEGTAAQQIPHPCFVDPVDVDIIIEVFVRPVVSQRVTVLETRFPVNKHLSLAEWMLELEIETAETTTRKHLNFRSYFNLLSPFYRI